MLVSRPFLTIKKYKKLRKVRYRTDYIKILNLTEKSWSVLYPVLRIRGVYPRARIFHP
jgi:hypothetical protein